MSKPIEGVYTIKTVQRVTVAKVQIEKQLTVQVDKTNNVTISTNFTNSVFNDAWSQATNLALNAAGTIVKGNLADQAKSPFSITHLPGEPKKAKGVVTSTAGRSDNGDDGVWEGEEE